MCLPFSILSYSPPPPSGQMWSSAGAQRLMLGGGDRGLGVEDDPTKGQLTVQEEVELLVHQEP